MSARRCTTSGVTIADLRSGGDAVSISGGGLSQVLPEGMATPLSTPATNAFTSLNSCSTCFDTSEAAVNT